MASNWRQATQPETLECPKCTAMNRPGATIIEFDPRTKLAVCGVCSHAWPAVG